MGESGSGKSVTSLATMGLLPEDSLAVTAGRITLDGVDLTRASPATLRKLRATSMAMIFQEPMTALNPLYRVGSQIDEVVREHSGKPAKDRRALILKMLRDVHLPDVERIYDSYPHQLSGGQRQRVMIAMALVLRPKLLIADEPTTALDVTTQKQIIKLIRDLTTERDTAVLFISHDMGVVADIADKIVVMKAGQIVEQGTVDEVLRNPKEDYTKALLRAVPSLDPRPARPAPEGGNALEVHDLAKSYTIRSGFRVKSIDAAKDVNFTLSRGRTIGIVGESGSGKSTVARCLVRLIDPTGGSVEINGKDFSNLPARNLKEMRGQVQIVFQDPNRSLNPKLTAGESIIEGLRNFGVDRDKATAQAKALLIRVGLPEAAFDRYPHQFSGGQRQRIAIARAVALRPSVLIADEAVSALDVSVQEQVLELLDELQREMNLAIVFITHDLRVAAQICDEIIVMKSGVVVEAGKAEDVLRAPSHDYTKSLIDSAPGRDWNFTSWADQGSASKTRH